MDTNVYSFDCYTFGIMKKIKVDYLIFMGLVMVDYLKKIGTTVKIVGSLNKY